MSDTAAEGSVVQPGAVPAGAPEARVEGAENGSAAPPAENPFSGLQDEGARKWVETKGYKSPEDIIKAAQSLEQRLGTTLTPPKDDAPKEEWDKFYGRLGRPEAPDKYEFKRPEGLPEDLPYNQEMAEASKNWMHEAGLNPRQAQAIHDKFAGYMADQQKALQEQTAAAVEATHADLTKDWGPAESEGFKTKLTLADRAIKKLGLSEVFQKVGVLLPDGALTDARIAKAFAPVGETMFREDTIGNDPLATGGNPFKKGPNGERYITAISALVKNDPAKAARLAREAGENPAMWGIKGNG